MSENIYNIGITVEVRTTVTKWEYNDCVVEEDDKTDFADKLRQRLNGLGQIGWEVIQIDFGRFSESQKFAGIYMKRPISS